MDSANSANSASLPWGQPISLGDLAVPPFPTDALPDVLRAFVEATAMATQTPPDLAGMLVLAALATACAGKARVEVRPGYEEPLNLYTLVVLPSANRKSAVFRHVTAPILDFERDLGRRLAPQLAEAEQRRRMLESRLKRAEQEAAQAMAGDRAHREHEALALVQELRMLHVPAVPQLIADDVTPEGVVRLLAEQEGRIAVLSPEGDIFDIMGGRYSANSTPNIGVFLKGHAGDPIRVNRAGQPPRIVDAPALTLGLTVQPNVIEGLARHPSFQGRGLLARFLYAVPHSTLGSRVIDPPPISFDITRAYEQLVRGLLEMTPRNGAGGMPPEHRVQLSEKAYHLLHTFNAWLEPQLGDFGNLAGVADWAGKLAGAVARIAGLLHLAEHATAAALWEQPISADTMERAIKLGRYLIPHARTALGMVGLDPTIAGARHALRWVSQLARPTFTKRDAFEALKGRFKRVPDLEPALRLLEEHGYIRCQTAEKLARSGRPASPVYEITPLISQAHNSHNSQNGCPGDSLLLNHTTMPTVARPSYGDGGSLEAAAVGTRTTPEAFPSVVPVVAPAVASAATPSLRELEPALPVDPATRMARRMIDGAIARAQSLIAGGAYDKALACAEEVPGSYRAETRTFITRLIASAQGERTPAG